MDQILPQKFLDRLTQIIPSEFNDEVLASFAQPKEISVRVNTLKISKDKLKRILTERSILFEEVPLIENAFVLKNVNGRELSDWDLVKEGLIYRQSLSSMLVALLLGPVPGERILDLCAAPGSKTTLLAGLMNNTGEILALEAVKNRYYKLRSVCELLGANQVFLKLLDGRRYRNQGLDFDRILVDAPCSSEGRFNTQEPKTFAYWSERKIREMRRKQRGLLLNATRLVKPGGCIVYSTCTFAPEENEGVVNWVLRKTQESFSVEPIKIPQIKMCPGLETWRDKTFNPQVRNCVRILPLNGMDAFFIAKLVRNL